MFKNLLNILTAPNDAFAAIREKPTILVPLLFIAMVMASVQYGYFQVVDREFLIEQLIEQTQAFVNAPEDQLRANLEDTNPKRLAVQSVISVMIVVPLVMCIYAGYLSLISKFTYDEIPYRQWLSLTVWSGIPSLFIAIAGWVVLLTNDDGMIGIQDLNPLTLNSLIFQTQGEFSGLLNAINLSQIWSVILMSIGYRKWTDKSSLKSAIIVLAPYLIILAIAVIVILT